MKKVKQILATTGIGFAMPLMAFAQNADPDLGAIESLLKGVGDLVSLALPIAVALALLFFIWGLAQFILASGDPDAKETGKQRMIWGVVALFVIVAVWGIVGFIGEIFGIDTDATAEEAPGVRLRN